MFTGLIEETGRIRSIRQAGADIRLTIDAKKVLEDSHCGDSISVNGICLTVVELGNGFFAADVMPETLRRSSLGILRPGSPVNLERALKLGDRLGGHLVSGHIDGTGVLLTRTAERNAIILRVSAPAGLLRYIIEKGSVAMDGVSLTVAEVNSESFSVSIIPHSSAVTIIGNYQPGDRINIECDMIGKYVEKLLNPEKATRPITLDFLAENGF
ncbi:MAG TPA: riboflavin synthase [Clostridiales bacterium]|nr:riboflavin synthase [Clostridiales bacterium]